MEHISRSLLISPLGEYQSAGRYYHAIALERAGRVSHEAFKNELLKIADNPREPMVLRARSLLTLGSRSIYQGDPATGLRYLSECLKAGRGLDSLATLQAAVTTTFLRSVDGDHKGALLDLENLLPGIMSLAQVYPVGYYIYLNDLAYELAQVGDLLTARHLINKACSSQYARVYPEWYETRLEIKQKLYHKKRSFIIIHRETSKEAIGLIDPKPIELQSTISRVSVIQDWKEKLNQEAQKIMTAKEHVRCQISKALFHLERLSLEQMKFALQTLAPPEDDI